VFFGPYKARIRAERIGVGLAQRRLALAESALQTQYGESYRQMRKYFATVSYYQAQGLAQTDEQIRIAQVAFRYGEIGYIEFVQNITLAVQSKLQYLAALNQYNQSVITLNFLTGK